MFAKKIIFFFLHWFITFCFVLQINITLIGNNKKQFKTPFTAKKSVNNRDIKNSNNERQSNKEKKQRTDIKNYANNTKSGKIAIQQKMNNFAVQQYIFLTQIWFSEFN